MATKKFGKVVDLSKLLGSRTIKPRIERVGIELEGGWLTQPAGETIIRDGSVVLDPGQRSQFIGEIPGPPLPLNEWEGWLRRCYPLHVNRTCGMHVHVSFTSPLYYMLCMDPRLPATIVEQVRVWAGDVRLPESHYIWPRLRGESRYCQHVYSAEEQILATSKGFDQNQPGNRYSVLNYGYSRNGTIECRLLPMMETPDLAVQAINQVLDTFNAFLVATATKEKPKVVKLEDDNVNSNPTRVRQVFV